ncbi:NlpC/P60 family protein [Streptomyces sp. NBC_01476]|uniref:C40 family peptidase n=1 Tax=Streptomyces sp. NBC_01476 TaxID=2903881 RepID=UPI002E375F2A|nr:NlpC/P60 family protein [Streptomyces sp. NBC_01476]
MASHSRDPHLRMSRSLVSRAACTLAIASAASAALFGETAQADPAPTTQEVKAQVDALYHEAEQATEQYNGAKEQADTARAAVDDLQDELARKTAKLNATRDTVGALAAAQYRSGGIDPALQLALNATPDTYLDRAATLDRLGARVTTALTQLTGQQRDIEHTRAEAAGRLSTLRSAQDRLAARKQTVRAKLSRAQELLARLTAAERARIEATDAGAAPGASTRGTVRPPLTAGAAAAPASARAAQAVAFAYRSLGLPYVWGATGPNSFDCSGLTQASWRSAGVSLPRTTYAQVNAGARVSLSQLRPGDLVFFYSGLSHVGIYIGNGRMIHAPHPGAPVRIAPISEMPFAAAVRPA